jgi:hypothetical protein
MKKLITATLLGSAVLTAQAMAQTPSTPPVKCRVAEVNPVTNHAHCIDPLGAPLAAKTDKPCQGMQRNDQWAMSNGCNTAPAANSSPN